MQSKDVLKDAIKAFDGTAVIVSHDREFLDGLVEKVYEFGGGKVREYLGGIYDWIRSHENLAQVAMSQTPQPAQAMTAKQGRDKAKDETGRTNDAQTAGRRKADPKGDEQPLTAEVMNYAERKERQRQASRLQKQIKESEDRIARLETELQRLNTLLCDPANAADMKLVNDYTAQQADLDKEMERWELLSEKYEEVKI